MNEFDQRVTSIMTQTPEGRRFQGPMIEVADTLETCKLWFDAHEVPYTAVDLLAMANMVIKRERELSDAAKRAMWERTHGMEEPA
jgi:hypothetical protein